MVALYYFYIIQYICIGNTDNARTTLATGNSPVAFDDSNQCAICIHVHTCIGTDDVITDDNVPGNEKSHGASHIT